MNIDEKYNLAGDYIKSVVMPITYRDVITLAQKMFGEMAVREDYFSLFCSIRICRDLNTTSINYKFNDKTVDRLIVLSILTDLILDIDLPPTQHTILNARSDAAYAVLMRNSISLGLDEFGLSKVKRLWHQKYLHMSTEPASVFYYTAGITDSSIIDKLISNGVDPALAKNIYKS